MVQSPLSLIGVALLWIEGRFMECRMHLRRNDAEVSSLQQQLYARSDRKDNSVDWTANGIVNQIDGSGVSRDHNKAVWVGEAKKS